jgi:hypothetical protein
VAGVDMGPPIELGCRVGDPTISPLATESFQVRPAADAFPTGRTGRPSHDQTTMMTVPNISTDMCHLLKLLGLPSLQSCVQSILHGKASTASLGEECALVIVHF